VNWLQFFASVVGSIAWPTAAVAITLLLRKSIVSLLPNLRRVKYKGLEAEFGIALQEVEKEVAQLPEPIALPSASQETEQEVQASYEQFSNNSAIFVAWLSVESAILNLARSAGILETNMPASRAAQLLLENKMIDGATYRAVQDLQSLRNLAVHPDEISTISDEQTKRFKKMAEKVTAVLEDTKRSLQ